MTSLLASLGHRFADSCILEANVIPWSCPGPVFGDLGASYVATRGLNPSNREFVDQFGNELDGPARRFQTLTSLGLARWPDARASHIRKIWISCQNYFSNNPYDRWF